MPQSSTERPRGPRRYAAEGHRHHELTREQLADKMADFLLAFDAAMHGGNPKVERVLGDLLAIDAHRELGARRN